MLALLRTEWLKLKNYRAFWLVIIFTALSYPGINYFFLRIYDDIIAKKETAAQIVKMLLGNPFTFPEAFHTITYFSSAFVVIPAIVVIMSITNEYTYRTSRQNIIDGWSRSDFLWAKFGVVVLITFMVTIICALVVLIIGYLNVADSTDVNRWSMVYYIGLFALQTFSQLSIAFLVGLLVRKAFVALAIFFFYAIIFENIVMNVLKFKANDIGRFLPLEISDRLIPPPAFIGRIDPESYKVSMDSINIHIVYTVILTLLTWMLCFFIYNRRNI